MFEILPLEIVEKILFLLSSESILSLCSAFNIDFKIFSDYFWKTICNREDFALSHNDQEWHDSFQCGVSKRTGKYVKLNHLPHGHLEHICLRVLVTKVEKCFHNIYCVFYVDQENTFNLTQELIKKYVQFKDEFCMFSQESQIVLLKLNINENVFEFHKAVPVEETDSIFGINSKYCAVHLPRAKHIDIFTSDRNMQIEIPPDVKFLIDKVLHDECLIVSVLTLTEGYIIKQYNIHDESWTVNVFCFHSTGLTNAPNVWVGSHFMACCDVSYRLRGIYFGPFKIWDRKGTLLHLAEIGSSNKHFLRCFFKENFIILTTSDTTITVFDSNGQVVNKLNVNTFTDIKLSSGYLLFVLLEGRELVKVYDWQRGVCLYDIKLNSICNQSLFSEFLYCPISGATKTFEVIKFC